MGVVRVLVTTVLLSLFAVKYCEIKHGHKFNQYTETITRGQTWGSNMLPFSWDFTERTVVMELLQLYVLFLATRIIQAAKRKRNKTEAFTTFFLLLTGKKRKKLPPKYAVSSRECYSPDENSDLNATCTSPIIAHKSSQNAN